jgi:hypothetical protein
MKAVLWHNIKGWGDNTSHEVPPANSKRPLLPSRAQETYDREMANYNKTHSTYLRDLSACGDHIVKSGAYDDKYGEVLDTRGRVLEAPTTPERPISPPGIPHRKSRRTTSSPTLQAITASSGSAFSQELRTRGQLWEIDRVKNNLYVPRLNQDLAQEKAEEKILAFSEPASIYASRPTVRITLDTAVGTSIVSDSRLLRDLHAYHGPSVYSIGLTAPPLDTIGTLLLFNVPSLLLTSC